MAYRQKEEENITPRIVATYFSSAQTISVPFSIYFFIIWKTEITTTCEVEN